MSKLSIYYEPLRMVLGDRDDNVKIYEDASLRKVLQSVIGMGKLTGYTLINSLNEISPDIPNDGTGDPNKFALLLYHAAKIMAAPDQGGYSYRTRALSETFGSTREFIADLEINIHQLEGGSHFRTWQSFVGWYTGITGINLWEQYSDFQAKPPFNTVTLNPHGTTVN